MPSEQPLKIACQICGAMHPTTGHAQFEQGWQKSKESAEVESRKEFVEVEGVRFDGRFPKESIEKVVEIMRFYEKELREKEKSEDPRSKLQHILVSSSAPTTRFPTTPLAFQAGTRSREQIIDDSLKLPPLHGGGFSIQILSEENGEQYFPGSWVGFSMTPASAQDLAGFIKKGWPDKREFYNLRFGKFNLDPNTLRYNFPNLEAIGGVELPTALRGRIKLAWVEDPQCTRIFSRTIGERCIAIIDEKGWRLEKE